MVVAVTAGHSTIETFEKLWGLDLGALYFVMLSIYFIPVVYASLNFGGRGAIPTAIWAACLTIPNIVFWHEGLERAGEALQMLVVISLAVVIAGRVDKETAARQLAERRERARQVSEIKYRQLFDGVGEPIVVFDAAGVIRESNAAAAALLGRPADLKGVTLGQAIGRQAARNLLRVAAGTIDSVDLALKQPDGSEVWIEPVCAPLVSEDEGILLQALLRDVTERRSFQSYAQETTRALEEERQHIARELHDVGLQTVVVLCRRLDAIQEASRGELPAPVAQALVEARQTAELLADELRRFGRDLRPVVLDDLGLVPAMRRLVSELTERSGMRGRIIVTGVPQRLDQGAELPLYRISQEALRNVERHAGASRVMARLTYQTDSLRLTIADDGKGFELPSYASLAGRGRFGLLGMRERARLLGGSCKIMSRPGKGTRVEVSIPLHATRRPQTG